MKTRITLAVTLIVALAVAGSAMAQIKLTDTDTTIRRFGMQVGVDVDG